MNFSDHLQIEEENNVKIVLIIKLLDWESNFMALISRRMLKHINVLLYGGATKVMSGSSIPSLCHPPELINVGHQPPGTVQLSRVILSSSFLFDYASFIIKNCHLIIEIWHSSEKQAYTIVVFSAPFVIALYNLGR